MDYISSDTNVWIDFSAIRRTELPFRLPFTYIMSELAIEDELITPPGIGQELVSLGLMPVKITMEEFAFAESLGLQYIKLSVYDRIALAIAKNRGITLLTGDGALRKAARQEGVSIMGTLGIFDCLWDGGLIDQTEYADCLQNLKLLNGGIVRLPGIEIEDRLRKIGSL